VRASSSVSGNVIQASWVMTAGVFRWEGGVATHGSPAIPHTVQPPQCKSTWEDSSHCNTTIPVVILRRVWTCAKAGPSVKQPGKAAVITTASTLQHPPALRPSWVTAGVFRWEGGVATHGSPAMPHTVQPPQCDPPALRPCRVLPPHQPQARWVPRLHSAHFSIFV